MNNYMQEKIIISQSNITWAQRDQGRFDLVITGNLVKDFHFPSRQKMEKEVEEKTIYHLRIIATDLVNWDSRLIAFLFQLEGLAREKNINLGYGPIPERVSRLLELLHKQDKKTTVAKKRPLKNKTPRTEPAKPLVEQTVLSLATFLGEFIFSVGRFLCGKAYGRWSDYGEQFRQVSVDALGIVAVINFLTGIILGFIGASQLARFGATIYSADLVAIAMAREMAPIMTGIILAGRTGASFAATLGTMQVNEEIDALNTLAIPPMEFLVLPRVFATLLMMPFLCLFAFFIGIAGGLTVATSCFNFTCAQYLTETVMSLSCTDFFLGLIKGTIFALLLSLLGCWHGINCSRNAVGVGRVTTAAAVWGIIAIVFADGIFAFLCNLLAI